MSTFDLEGYNKHKPSMKILDQIYFSK